MDVLEAAKVYLAHGWLPVQVPHRAKGPVLPGWQTHRLVDAELPLHFSVKTNIGLLLGEASRGLVDVDLDAPEALGIADTFLPATGRVHGRPGKPRSHYWYMVEPIPRPKKYQDIDGTCLVELRSTGQQTLVPPSVHPSGETLVWLSDGDPAHLQGQVLSDKVSELAACALIARHWSAVGSRQDLSLALAGVLARAGWESDETKRFIEAAARIADDEEVAKRSRAVEDTFKRLAGGQPVTGIPRLFEIFGDKVTHKVIEWLRINPREPNHANTRKERTPAAAETLIGLVAQTELFHTPDSEAFATFEVTGHLETWPLGSSEFKQWLTQVFYLSQKKPPNDQALTDTIRVLEAKARFEGPTRQVFLRVAKQGSVFYLDLANDAWEVVEITPAGWRVVRDCPVRFRRTPGMQPLPYPVAGSSLQKLRPFVNVADDNGFRLLLAWLLATLRPTGPYPILVLQGEQGSAKSTTARVLRALIDPSAIPLRSLPRDDRDFMIAAKNAWLPAFDNLSGLSAAMSDALCRLATGGGYATRALYSNDAEVLLNVQRAAILNGIDDLATRHDLIDRTLLLTLPPIPETARRDEETFWLAFEAARPAILGALLDALSDALGRLPGVKLIAAPRLADFARLATAAEISLGWESGGFLAAYAGNRSEAIEVGLDGHPTGQAIRSMMEQETAWTGTAEELLRMLTAHADRGAVDTRLWPKTAAELGKQLRRLTPALRAVGVDYTHNRVGHNRSRTIQLARLGPAVRTVRLERDAPLLPSASRGLVVEDADGLRTAAGIVINDSLSVRHTQNFCEFSRADYADKADSMNSETEIGFPIPDDAANQKDGAA